MGMTTARNNPKQSSLDREVYSLSEFAKLCGSSYTVFHQLAQAGALPVQPIRIGRRYLFAKSAVHALLSIETPSDRDAA